MMFRGLSLLVALAVLGTPGKASAGQVFNESFDGGLDNAWLSSPGVFPSAPSGSTLTYLGAPGGVFTTVDGAQAFRMTNTLTQWQQVGFVTEQTFGASDLELEARINTLVQDTQRIDGFFRLWLINADDPGSFVNFGFFGSNSSQDRRFLWGGSVDSNGSSSFNYGNNTWYRLRLTAEGDSLRVAVLSDATSEELLGHTFSHSLSALGSNFRIGIDQFLGLPTTPYIVDVAVDSVVLSTSTAAVPEPSSLAIAGSGLLALILAARELRRRK